MNFKDIKQFKVDKGIAVPVNPFYFTIPHKDDLLSHNEFSEINSINESYGAFESWKQSHTYATNAPDGIHNTYRFEQPVWQYEIEGEKGFWFNSGNEVNAFKDNYQEYSKYMIEQVGCLQTRRLLPFKLSPENKQEFGECRNCKYFITTKKDMFNGLCSNELQEYNNVRSNMSCSYYLPSPPKSI